MQKRIKRIRLDLVLYNRRKEKEKVRKMFSTQLLQNKDQNGAFCRKYFCYVIKFKTLVTFVKVKSLVHKLVENEATAELKPKIG